MARCSDTRETLNCALAEYLAGKEMCYRCETEDRIMRMESTISRLKELEVVQQQFYCCSEPVRSESSTVSGEPFALLPTK